MTRIEVTIQICMDTNELEAEVIAAQTLVDTMRAVQIEMSKRTMSMTRDMIAPSVSATLKISPK